MQVQYVLQILSIDSVHNVTRIFTGVVEVCVPSDVNTPMFCLSILPMQLLPCISSKVLP